MFQTFQPEVKPKPGTERVWWPGVPLPTLAGLTRRLQPRFHGPPPDRRRHPLLDRTACTIKYKWGTGRVKLPGGPLNYRTSLLWVSCLPLTTFIG